MLKRNAEGVAYGERGNETRRMPRGEVSQRHGVDEAIHGIIMTVAGDVF